jgi:predicted permease
MRGLISSFRLRVRTMMKRRQLERDLEDELACHLEQRAAQEVAAVPFGNATRIRENCRELWTFHQLEDLWRELRHAARYLRNAPGHTAAIVVLLSLGIGLNSAMFSLVNAIFIRDLPVHEPQHLATLNAQWSTPVFEEFRRTQTSFSGLFATGSLIGTVVATEKGVQLPRASGGIASGNYFEVLGVSAVLGRVFTEDDDHPENPQPAIVIAHAFWKSQFGGDPQVLGRRLLLAGSPFTIIGVTSETFIGEMPGRPRDFWVPLTMQPVANPQGDLRRNRGYHWLSVMGRLKPGVLLQQAQAESDTIYGRVTDEQARRAQQRDAGPLIRLEPGSRGLDLIRRRFGTQLWILGGTVAVVLLIVCMNVATLLLARGTVRQRELAVRQALGCTRARLARQLLVEGLLLAGTGGIIGLWLSAWIAEGLLIMDRSLSTMALDLSVDRNLLLFGGAISLVCAVVFSLAPALRSSRISVAAVLKSAPRGATGSRSRQRALRSMIAVQTALSVILVAAALLFARSLFQLQRVDVGYERDHMISATINARLAGYRDDAAQAALGQRLVDRLSALPGVKSASVGLCAVGEGCSRMRVLNMDGHAAQPDGPAVWVNTVSSSYFETAGIPILAGRGFGPQDKAGAPRVAVVTSALARFYFPDGNALGKRFAERTESGSSGSQVGPVEIVGVIRDIKFVNPRDPAIKMVFFSTAQLPTPFSYVQVRTAGSPQPVVSAVRAAILEVDNKLYIAGPRLLSDLQPILSRDMLLSRASMLFGLIALLLACCGVYGVISYLVAAKKAELGIRLAIGAHPGTVRRHVIGDALRAVLPGVVFGIGGAWAVGRLLESLLFGVTGGDPLTHLAVAAILLTTTALAAYVPALRASRIDPLATLRCE